MEYSCDPQDAYYRNVIVEGAIDWQSEIGGTGAIPISHRSPPVLGCRDLHRIARGGCASQVAVGRSIQTDRGDRASSPSPALTADALNAQGVDARARDSPDAKCAASTDQAVRPAA